MSYNNYRNERPNNFLKSKLNKKLFLFNNESFPDLISSKNPENSKKEENENSNSLFTKVLHAKLEEEEKEREKEEEEKEKKRWIVIKKGVPYQKKEELEKKQEEEEVDPRKVFEQLTKNYEKWKKNYIESWGYDDYEHHYRFPNHDYRCYETSDSNSDLEDY
jgi:hypothetical protein